MKISQFIGKVFDMTDDKLGVFFSIVHSKEF